MSRKLLRSCILPLQAALLTGTVLALGGCSRPSTLQEIRNEGVLHVIARQAPSIYHEGRDGPTGYDYELARRLADELGVTLRVRVAEDNTEILSVLDRNYAHIGLAGISLQPGFEERYRALPTGIRAQSVLVYHRGLEHPDSLEALAGETIHLAADSDHENQLASLTGAGQVSHEVHSGLDAAGVLARVESGEFAYAIVYSNELELNQVFYPHVKRAFALGEPRELVWLFPKEQDPTLYEAASAFLDRLRNDGTLAQLSERFYGHLDRLNYVGARTFMHHVRNRLPKYEALFRKHAARYGMDWRLLAAIGYQESHWRPNAVSPTGVRGLMMLTRTTASHIGINNRLDADESILGGAKYLQMVYNLIPERIPEPDRTWFALASYNVGFGHLEDARKLTEQAGKNPDRWMDVKEFLPLLAQKEWYRKTRFGYARGHEPVIYVQNIRRYYDVLTRITDEEPLQDGTEQTYATVETDMTPESAGDAPDRHKVQLPSDLAFIPPTL